MSLMSKRNDWLAALSCQQFLKLDPWAFVCHEESRPQWIAEVRKKIRSRLSDDEILSVLYSDLYDTTKSAIRNYAEQPAAGRGTALIGYALKYIRLHGLAKIFDEIPAAQRANVVTIDTVGSAPRAHALEHEYTLAVTDYTDGLSVLPQFLSDGVVLGDEGLQAQHQNIERLRRFLSTREYQLLRLSVLEQHSSIDISEMLDLSAKQVWKIRRTLRDKLGEIALDQGACPQLVSSLNPRLAGAVAK